MKKVTLGFLLLFLWMLPSQAQSIQGEILSDSGNLKVVRVWGTHYDRGFAYGYLCEPYIMAVWDEYVVPNYGTVLPFARAIIANPGNFSIDSIFITEAQGIIDGLGAAGADTSGLSYLDLFVVNFMTDLEGFMPKAGFNTQQCSSLMNWGDATLNTDLAGKSVIAHHLDALSYDSVLAHNQVMVIHLPTESNEQAWLLTGVAGQMVASQAVNVSGIAAFVNTVNNFSATAGSGYEPMTLTLRKSLERADFNGDGLHNTNDVRAALLSNSQGYARGFVVCAIAPSSCLTDTLISMVAELAPSPPAITFRHTADVDSLIGDNLYAANEMIKRSNAQNYSSRYLQVKGAINGLYGGAGIGAQDNWDIMLDYSTQSTSLQFIQVIPEWNQFLISVSDNGLPAYHFAPQEFDLQELFSYSSVDEFGQTTSILKLFPNPAFETLSICFDGHTGSYPCVLTDITGRILLLIELQSGDAVDVSALSHGLYFLHINTPSGTLCGKFLKR